MLQVALALQALPEALQEVQVLNPI